jgi:hypothetical protein
VAHDPAALTAARLPAAAVTLIATATRKRLT